MVNDLSHPMKSQSPISIYLVAPRGKMGLALQSAAKTSPFHTSCLFVDDPKQADVVVDFSSPEGTQYALGLSKPLVCGTTGLSPSLMKLLESKASEIPLLYSSNFSIGMSYLFRWCEMIQKNHSLFQSIHIHEAHHATKKDAPSGTAKTLAQLLLLPEEMISFERTGDVVGIHQVTLTLDSEEVTISHQCHSRKPFATGALYAALFLSNKPPGLYHSRDLFS